MKCLLNSLHSDSFTAKFMHPYLFMTHEQINLSSTFIEILYTCFVRLDSTIARMSDSTSQGQVFDSSWLLRIFGVPLIWVPV